MNTDTTNIIIAGPTACNKSNCAMDIALSLEGQIVNADSMQIYNELAILTARPNKQDSAKVPHHLYGNISWQENYSAAKWLEQANSSINLVQQTGHYPIIIGGTGLYINALINGISFVPTIDQKTKNYVSELIQHDLNEGFNLLMAKDPCIAKQVNPNDTYRITRALEVIMSTGKSLNYWNNIPNTTIPKRKFFVIYLNPERRKIQAVSRQRLQNMFANGAIEEVKSLLSHHPKPTNNIMNAIGVKEIQLYLDEKISLSEAFEQAFIATRQYIKRQQTWFKKYLKPDITINDTYNNSHLALLLNEITKGE